MSSERVNSSDAPKPIGPYSQAIRVGDTLFLSGQVALDPGTGQIVDGDVRVQAQRVLDNLKAVLLEARMTMAQVARTTIYLIDLADFGAVNQVYQSAFSEPYPARSTVQVMALPGGSRIEIDAIAVR